MKNTKFKWILPAVLPLTALGSLSLVGCGNQQKVVLVIEGGRTEIEATPLQEQTEKDPWQVKKNDELVQATLSLVPVEETALLDGITINNQGFISWKNLEKNKVYKFQVKAVTTDEIIYSQTITMNVGEEVHIEGGITSIECLSQQEGSDTDDHIWKIYKGEDVIGGSLSLQDESGSPIDDIYIENGKIKWNALSRGTYKMYLVAVPSYDLTLSFKKEINFFVYEEASQDDFTWTKRDEGAKTISINKWNSSDPTKTCIILPSKYNLNGVEYTVTAIENVAFQSVSNLNCIRIPSSIATIGAYSFNYLQNLKMVAFDDGSRIKTLPNSAFEACALLEKISLPPGLETIGENAFKGCYKLNNIVLPNSIKEVGKRSFSECKSLESISFSSGLKSLGEECFSVCESLKYVLLPDGCTFGVSCFANDTSLESIRLPADLEEIPESAFSNTSLKLIDIPLTVKTIGYRAFYSSKLTSVVLPSSLTSMGYGAFECCKELKIVQFAENASITSLPDSCFWECQALTSIAIPNFVTLIDQTCFYRCENLKKVFIPSSCTTFKGGSFAYCEKLELIEYDWNLANWFNIDRADGWHGGCPDECIVKCKDGQITLGEC